MSSFRYAIRTLLKTPGFTAIAVATIALGIAANSAIFSVVHGVLLTPLPFRDEARIVTVWTSMPNEAKSGYSAGNFLDLQRDGRALEALAGYREDNASIAARPGEPSEEQVAWVTPGFFDVLGTPPALGRTFTQAQNGTPGERFVVLSDSAWRHAFAGDTGVVGRRIRVNGDAFTVAAVMPATFQWPEGTEAWLMSPGPVPPSPLDIKDADPLTNRDVQYFDAVGRLKPGVSLARAQQDLHLFALDLQQRFPKVNGGRDMRAIGIREDLTGDVSGALILIQAAVGLVLLIACANVSSLLIARATGRRRELAIRAAIGASRLHLLRQLLAESLVLGLSGGVVGLFMAAWLVVLLVRILPEGLPRAQTIALDSTVMIVTIGASLLTGMLFGILPALQGARAQAVHAIKAAGERGSTRARGRSVLVVGEIALTLVLLVGAALLANSFLKLERVDTGFSVDHVTIADLAVPQNRYPKGPDQVRLYHRLLDGLAGRPELQAVGVGFPGPFHGANASGSFYVEGRASAGHGDAPFAHLGTVSGGYFRAMGIPLLAGRPFAATDIESAPPVAIVSASLAKRYWPGQNPVGKRLRFEDNDKEPWFTVVGLVADVRQLGVSEQAPALLYLPYEQFAIPFTSVAVRSTLPDGAVASLLRSQLATLDPDLPFGDIETLHTVMERSVGQPRFRATLIGTFALLALVLATVGVYGLISYTVTQRTREIGIRVALGAAPRQVVLPVVGEGLTLAAIGVAIGLAGALALTRALSTYLFGVGASDPLTFTGVALLLLTIAAAASYIPSRRALKVDPMVALRAE